MADFDNLTPTQWLIMEVLGARWRLGEQSWPFPTTMNEPIAYLEHVGLVHARSDAVPKHTRVGLTEAGYDYCFAESPTPPPRRLDALVCPKCGCTDIGLHYHQVNDELRAECSRCACGWVERPLDKETTPTDG